VRVTVDLVDARTNTTIASRSIEHTVDAGIVFRVQDDVSERVAAFLRQRLGDEIRVIVSRMGTTSARAQELDDRARYLHNTASALRAHGLESDIATAVRMLRSSDSLLAEAERVDPRWTSIRIERGWIARDLARLTAEDVSRGEFARAIEFADRVLSRDSVDARALELRGTARWQLARTFGDSARPRNMALAEADLRRAMSLDSTRVVAAAAVSQLIRGRARNRDDLGQAIAFARQAYRQDAFLANAEDAVSQLYRATKALGQIDSARVWCARGHELAPDDWRFVECELALMRVDLSRARSRRARALIEELDLLDPPAKARAAGHPYSPIYRRLVAAAVRGASGERDSARAELARALQEVKPDSDMMTDIKHDETLVRLAIGDRTGAMVALRRYLERRPEFAGGVLNDPAYRQFGLDSAALADGLQLRSGARR
jgi:tetratricopeptide (TPR) repeat protein